MIAEKIEREEKKRKKSKTKNGNGNEAHRWKITISVSLHVGIYQLVSEHASYQRTLGAVSIRKTVLPGMAIPMLKIRRPNGRLIFNMEITIRR